MRRERIDSVAHLY